MNHDPEQMAPIEVTVPTTSAAADHLPATFVPPGTTPAPAMAAETIQ